MKKNLLLILSAILFSISIYAHDAEVSQFGKVFVNVPAKVKVLKGETYNIEIVSNDTTVTNSIKYSIENNILKINASDDNEWLENNNVKIYITAPTTPVIKVGNNFNLFVINNKDNK